MRPIIWWWITKDGRMDRIERITKPSIGNVDSTVLAHRCTDDGQPISRQVHRVPTRELAEG